MSVVFSVDEIRGWRTGKVFREYRDQKRWLRKPRAGDFNASHAYTYLHNLETVLSERGHL